MLPNWSTGRWLLFRRGGHVADVIGKYAAIDRFFDQRHPVLQGVGRDDFITFIEGIIIIGRQREENMAGAVRPRIPQIAGIFIAHRIDCKAVNPADVNQADLVFIRRRRRRDAAGSSRVPA